MNSISQYPQQIIKNLRGDFKTDNQKQKVKIYLRKANKKTVRIYVETPISYGGVFELIEKNLGVPISELILFWKGMKIEPFQAGFQRLFHFSQNDIVHIHCITNTRAGTINITVKTLDCPNLQNRTYKIQTDYNEKIAETVSKYIENLEGLVLVYNGRKIDLNRSFQQEFIENDSTLVLTSFSQSNHLPKCKLATKSTLQSQNADKNKYNGSILEVKKPMVKKATSWSFSEQSQLYCSFKRKEKPSVYISTNTSNGQETIWQSDGSSKDIINSTHFKKLGKRRHNSEDQNNQAESNMQQKHQIIFSDEEDTNIFSIKQSKSKFTRQQKMQINYEVDKLLNGEGNGNVVKKYIEPPLIISNIDFLDDEEQLQINDGELQSEMQQPVVKIMNLEASIGKSRGTFIPAIPKQDILIDDNQQQF